MSNKAERGYKQALLIRRNIHGKDHSDPATSLWNLGWLYLKRCFVSEARDMLKQLKRIRVVPNEIDLEMLVWPFVNTKSFSAWIQDYVSVWDCYAKFDCVRYIGIQCPWDMMLLKKMLALGCHKGHLSLLVD